ncbi:MBL fold metallo-hydrolase [Streptomyces sp. NPDC005122]
MDAQGPRAVDAGAGERSPAAGTLDVRWIHGSPSAKHNTDPDIQVYVHDADTVILRQNMAVDYEAPFLFLLFGEARAVLIDTGATASPAHFPLRRVVDELIRDRPAAHPRDDYELLVLHTHPHGDHVAGDGQFTDRPRTRVVDAALDEAWRFFGFDRDPDGVARVDLGGRVLECLATPGHHAASVTYFDPRTGFLLTGDTVYPGRLYIEDWPAFTRTVDRLIGFCADRPVTHVLGCHIEMTRRPGVDYPVRTTYQPDEPPLQMTTGRLAGIRAAIDTVGDRPGRHVFGDFVLCRRDLPEGASDGA